MKIRDRRGQPRAYFHDIDADSMTASELIDAGAADRIDTGLLDEGGAPIYRRRSAVKFGFVP